MGEMILSALISFIVDTFGNFLFNKKLEKNVVEKAALNSKISYIQSIENKQNHNQINQNIINSNVIGNNNKTVNYNQNIQVKNETNIHYSWGQSTENGDTIIIMLFLIGITIAISALFFWLKNNIPYYLMLCFLIFIIGLIINKIYSYYLVKKYNYLFLEIDKYILFSVVLLLVMILIFSNIFEPQNFLQVEEQFKEIKSFKALLDVLPSSANFNFIAYYSIKNIMQVLIVVVPLMDVILALFKKRETILLKISTSNFILFISIYLIAFYLSKAIFYFN